MSKFRQYTAVACAAVVVLALSSASHAGRNAFHVYIEDHYMPMMKDSLQLSDDQVSKIKAIYDKAAKQDQDRHADYQRMRDAFIATSPNDADYDKKADQLADEAAMRIRSGVKSMADARKQVFAVLTPKQREQYMASDAYFMPMGMENMHMMNLIHNPQRRHIRGPSN